MKNKEKYKEEIIETVSKSDSCNFKIKFILKNGCTIYCDDCEKLTKKWFEEEYQEPIKLTQFEYDLLSIEYDRHYEPSEWKAYMKAWWNKGYLLSLKNLDMTIGDILDSCEVIEDE